MLCVIGGQKGGTGKSTIATNLAVALKLRGREVLLVDTDRQATASNWHDVRQEDESLPGVPCVQKTGKLFRVLKDLEGRYDDIVLDAGGFDSVELRSALPAADCLYSPVRASQSDLWTIEAMEELVGQARDLNPALQPYLVMSMAPTNPRITETLAAMKLLQQYEAFGTCESVLRDRKIYRDAMCQGQGVLEVNDAKAKAEFQAFAEEVMINAGISEGLARAV